MILSNGKRFLVAALGGLALALLIAPTVWAAGGLVQKKGRAGCISETGQEACAKGRGLQDVYTVAITTDGRSAYATGFESDSIAVFGRNARTGALTQKSGKAGCISESGKEGCRRGRALDGPRGIARTPDGRSVYVASPESNAVAIFSRNPRTGVLRQLPGKAGCISLRAADGCQEGRGLEFASGITTSPDGKTVYVAADDSNAVTVFRRNPRTGALTQLPGGAGCISQSGAEGCRKGRGLDGAFFVSKSPDGRSVYVASFRSSAIAIFRRNPKTGALTQPPGEAGCIAEEGSAESCADGAELGEASVFAVTPDGRSAYAISEFADSKESSRAIAGFSRNLQTGALRELQQPKGCMTSDGSGGSCEDGRALDGLAAATVSPDGRTIYVGSARSNAIAVLNRNPKTGVLTQATGKAGCVSRSGAEGCARGRGLTTVVTLAPSPDGRNLYAASRESNSIAVFDRR